MYFTYHFILTAGNRHRGMEGKAVKFSTVTKKIASILISRCLPDHHALFHYSKMKPKCEFGTVSLQRCFPPGRVNRTVLSWGFSTLNGPLAIFYIWISRHYFHATCKGRQYTHFRLHRGLWQAAKVLRVFLELLITLKKKKSFHLPFFLSPPTKGTFEQEDYLPGCQIQCYAHEKMFFK